MSWPRERRWAVAASLALCLVKSVAADTYFTEVTTPAFSAIQTRLPARSVAWGDYDNDGWPDLFVAENMGRAGVLLWHNEGNGRFSDHIGAIQGSTPGAKGGGSIFGDYDNDGDLDLYVPVGRFETWFRGLNLLLRNDQGVYRSIGREAALTDSLPTDNAIWLDYDRDGYLDLYTGNLAVGDDNDLDPSNDNDPTTRNRLYRNLGDGTLADVTTSAGLDLPLSQLCGGSNGGMVAADFNDDGWPDLYVGVFEDRNRLFLNDGQGRFQDATTAEIDDPGPAFDVTVGDIDNDGDLDLFQAAGGIAGEYRSLLLLNLMGGGFLDVTESAGFAAITQVSLNNARLGDLDNDGDLDLLTGWPHQLHLNDGHGYFAEATDRSGIIGDPGMLALSDYDRDGFLDACFGLVPTQISAGALLYRNNGNANHWLEVELVGTRSNRGGIGARVIAVAGDLRQTREILGGTGYSQDEMMAHFGLGEHTRIDSLVVRWPSGQVDRLEGIPVDQRLRVIEGQGSSWAVQPTRMEVPRPDTLVVGWKGEFALQVTPGRFDPGARITRVVADLSSLEGGAALPMQEQDDGSYLLQVPLTVLGPNGIREIAVSIDQQTGLGSPWWTRVVRSIPVLPATDLVIFDDALSPNWQESHAGSLEGIELAATDQVFEGERAIALQTKASFAGWKVGFQSAAELFPVGYVLRLAVYLGPEAGSTRSPRFAVQFTPGKAVVDLVADGLIKLDQQGWQVVEIPLSRFWLVQPLQGLSLSGNLTGTLYLDDLRLVAARSSSQPGTAVTETRNATLPQAFALAQNYPNPFNSNTSIRFSLPQDGEVDLAVYNLAGQRVAVLVNGVREAGTYSLTWNGRDEAGRVLASGVYICRLRVGEQEDTRKVVVVR